VWSRKSASIQHALHLVRQRPQNWRTVSLRSIMSTPSSTCFLELACSPLFFSFCFSSFFPSLHIVQIKQQKNTPPILFHNPSILTDYHQALKRTGGDAVGSQKICWQIGRGLKGLIYWLSFLLFVVDLFGRHVSEANHRGGVVCLMMENLAACHRFVGANELEQICGQVVNKLSKLTDCDNLWGKLMWSLYSTNNK